MTQTLTILGLYIALAALAFVGMFIWRMHLDYQVYCDRREDVTVQE